LKKTGEQDGLKKVVAYMNENYFNAEMNVAQACRTCGVSESNFRAKFKKKYAKTPIEYLMGLRLENAIRLLSIGEESIESIAEKSGFSDVKYFARVIKKKFGLPPSQLAKTLFV
jgi:AraC-like DNA-binding protein